MSERVDFKVISGVQAETFTGDLTGNADTATALETARTISLGGDLSGSASFDGTQNVTITATVQPNSVALGTDTTGNYVSDVTGGTGVTITHTPGEGSTPSIAIGQAVGASSSVTFAAVTAPVIGNASTASALQTARTISLGGDLSGSASFNGSSDVTITATVQPNSVALGTDTTGNYLSNVVSGSGITVTHTPGEGSSASVALNASLDDLNDVTAPAPDDGQFLKYVSASGAWVPAAVPTINTLDDIGDVNSASAVYGNPLIWNGTSWVADSEDFALGNPGVTGNSVILNPYVLGISSPIGFANFGYDGISILSDSGAYLLLTQNGITFTNGTDSFQIDPYFGTEGQVLAFTSTDGDSGVWSRKTLNLDDIANVSASAPGSGDVLSWDGTAWVAAEPSGGGPEQTNTTITTNSATTIASFDKDVANAAEFTVKVEQGNRLRSTKSLALHNGTIVDITQYGELSIGAFEVFVEAGTTWVTQTSTFGNSAIRSVAYGNNLWVAAGYKGQLRTSTDAITWTTRTSNFVGPGPNTILSVAYSNDLWVAAGYSGRINTSTDSITWTEQTSNFDSTIFSVAFGNNLWVAGGNSGQLRTSTDAITWTTQTSTFGGSQIRSVAFGNNLWVAAGGYGELRTSTDAITWVTRTSNFGATNILSVAYGNSLWVAAGSTGQLRTSTDAVTWVTQVSNFGTTRIWSVSYGNNLWFAAGEAGQIRTSTDAVTWTTRTSNFSNTTIQSVAFGDNFWVAGGYSGQLRTSIEESGFFEIPLSLSADISGSDVRLLATVTDASSLNATAKVLKTLVEE